MLLLAGAGLVAMYSAGYDHGTRFVDHGRNMLIAGTILFVVAQVPPQRIMAFAVPCTPAGWRCCWRWRCLASPKGRAALGEPGHRHPAQRDSENCHAPDAGLVVSKREGQLRPLDFVAAGALLAVPVGLIMKQPDLGTSLLVLAAGCR